MTGTLVTFGYAAETDAHELEREGARTITSLAELVPVLTGAADREA